MAGYDACTYPYKSEKLEKSVEGGSMKMKSSRVAGIFVMVVASCIMFF